MAPYRLTCSQCGSILTETELGSHCPKCNGILEHIFNSDYLRSVKFKGPINFWRYRLVMPSVERNVSLGEGGTPLWNAERLGDHLGLKKLFLKDETRNPTSSFKDRSASLMISDAVSKGFDSVVCATNGNHGASIAAYTAKEDLSCKVVVPSILDIGKLAQMIAYDADVEEAGSDSESAIARAIEIAEETGWYQSTTELNPLSVEAIKTISYEISEQDCIPDWVVVAMGSGVTIHAIWKGFVELEEMGIIEKQPRLIGVQSKNCSPIVEAFNEGKDQPVEIEGTETVASAINISKPIFGVAALEALKKSNGISVQVSDDAMLEFGMEIARSEGIFPEPASAASVACLPGLVDSGLIDKSDTVVCLITSSGLKTNDILKSLTKRRKSPGLGSRLATKERLLREVSMSRTYGYALWKGMKKEFTLGAIYQHITDLERRGLIKSEAEGKRRYLKITDRGNRVLSALEDLKVLL